MTLAALRRTAAATRRAEAALTRTDTQAWVMQRRERTRHLIELGGLVQKAGLVELVEDDRATLYGALLGLADMLKGDGGAALREAFRRRARTTRVRHGSGERDVKRSIDVGLRSGSAPRRRRGRTLGAWTGALLAACLASAGPSAAQTSDPELTRKAGDMLARLAQALSSPELPPSLPASPGRIAIMRGYLDSMGVDTVQKAVGEKLREQARSQVETASANLPQAQRPVVVSAFERSFAQADATRRARALDDITTYYATRMTDDELKTAVDFYDQGLGRKSILDAQHMTPDDRQAVGLFMLDHPAAIKFSKVNWDYTKHVLAQ